MAAVMINAASLAYRKASANIRDETKSNPDAVAWLTYIANQLPEDEFAGLKLSEPSHHRKERLLKNSNNSYEKLAWYIYINITSKLWFELFIMLNILLVGITTGIDLENQGRDKWTILFSNIINFTTLIIFTCEILLKLISEAYEPWRYFIDEEYGTYNIFDFIIVILSYIFIFFIDSTNNSSNSISGLRMLRLIRLLTFIKHVPHLKVLVNGLIHGMRSVVYIVLLLFLTIYIFAVLSCNVFGENDPNHFGDTTTAMLTLFQVSTLGSWSSIAYISWYGCEEYLDGGYAPENPSRIHTMAGTFIGFQCDVNKPNPTATGAFWPLYILLTSWVIMSLFIGVISSGMFETYMSMALENNANSYTKHNANNTLYEAQARKFMIDQAVKTGNLSGNNMNTLKDKIDMIFEDDLNNYKLIGCVTGYETNIILRCERYEHRLRKNNEIDENDLEHLVLECMESKLPYYLVSIGIISQIIFTFEAFIKIASKGTKPIQYFKDKEDGSWNCLDFFIVIIGFMEYTKAGFLFKHFPIVLLRLLRLLRVFRVAKALPRLRSIVEALVSAFSTVKWICVLFAVFNYIVACLCMIVFRSNDPFHFGSLGRAMFSIFRIETLDFGGIILYIQVYGCAKYTRGYPYIAHSSSMNSQDNVGGMSCDDSESYGWFGAFLLFTITIIGSYVLPIVLIGVVSIKFHEATEYATLLKIAKKSRIKHLKQAKKDFITFNQHSNPNPNNNIRKDSNSCLFSFWDFLSCQSSSSSQCCFFTDERMMIIDDVFETLDSKDMKSLDMIEIAPFIHYVFDHLFEIELTSDEFESVFYLSDICLKSEIGIGEFIQLIKSLKIWHLKSMRNNEEFNKKFKLKSELNIKKYLNYINKIKKVKNKISLKKNNHYKMMDKSEIDRNKPLLEPIIEETNPSNHLLKKEEEINTQKEEEEKSKHDGLKNKQEKKKILKEKKNETLSFTESLSEMMFASMMINKSGNKGSCKEVMIPINNEISKWDNAMKRVDLNILNTTWDAILHAIKGIEAESINTHDINNNTLTMKEKVSILFQDFDTDKNGELDLSELGAGLTSCGIRLTNRQILALIKSLDIDNDGTISIDEFASHLSEIKYEKSMRQDEALFKKQIKILNSIDSSLGKEMVLKRRKSCGGGGSVVVNSSSDLKLNSNNNNISLNNINGKVNHCEEVLNEMSSTTNRSFDSVISEGKMLIRQRAKLLSEKNHLMKEILKLEREEIYMSKKERKKEKKNKVDINQSSNSQPRQLPLYQNVMDILRGGFSPDKKPLLSEDVHEEEDMTVQNINQPILSVPVQEPVVRVVPAPEPVVSTPVPLVPVVPAPVPVVSTPVPLAQEVPAPVPIEDVYTRKVPSRSKTKNPIVKPLVKQQSGVSKSVSAYSSSTASNITQSNSRSSSSSSSRSTNNTPVKIKKKTSVNSSTDKRTTSSSTMPNIMPNNGGPKKKKSIVSSSRSVSVGEKKKLSKSDSKKEVESQLQVEFV